MFHRVPTTFAQNIMSDALAQSLSRPGSMNLAERQIDRLDHFLPNVRFPSLVRWIQPPPTGPHGALPDGIRILAKNLLRPAEATLTVVGDVALEDFHVQPGAHFDAEEGISWPDIVSSFKLQAPRHVAFAGTWDRSLYHLNLVAETCLAGESAVRSHVKTSCLDLREGTMAFCHQFVRKVSGKCPVFDMTLLRYC